LWRSDPDWVDEEEIKIPSCRIKRRGRKEVERRMERRERMGRVRKGPQLPVNEW